MGAINQHQDGDSQEVTGGRALVIAEGVTDALDAAVEDCAVVTVDVADSDGRDVPLVIAGEVTDPIVDAEDVMIVDVTASDDEDVPLSTRKYSSRNDATGSELALVGFKVVIFTV